LPLHYLAFDLSEGSDGVTTLDAMASTAATQHAAVRAEAERVLAWCRQAFPHSVGPVDEGGDWDHDLLVSLQDGGWHTVTLTLTGSARFVEAFLAAFPAVAD
jgi:hypothetical protein